MLRALTKPTTTVQLCSRILIQSLTTARSPTFRDFHSTKNTFVVSASKEQLDQIAEVELPKKGKVAVPKHVQSIGDAMLSLNAFESMILSQYVRDKLGIDIDIPDAHTAMLKSGFGADLSQMLLGNIGGLGINPQLLGQLVGGMIQGGMAMQHMGAMPGMGMQQQQQQQQQAQQVAAEAPKEQVQEEVKVEKVSWDVKLEKFDEAKKIALIKELRRIDKNLSIKAAKDLVEGAPSVIQKDLNKTEAEKLKAELEAAGGTVSLV